MPRSVCKSTSAHASGDIHREAWEGSLLGFAAEPPAAASGGLGSAGSSGQKDKAAAAAGESHPTDPETRSVSPSASQEPPGNKYSPSPRGDLSEDRTALELGAQASAGWLL